MINQWWFKLYSINTIKKSLLFGAGALGFDLLTGYLNEPYPFGILLLISPFLPMGIKSVRSPMMRGNLEFHKMHVPLKKLRAAFYQDFLVCFAAGSLISFSVTGLSFLLGGGIAKDPQHVFASHSIPELTYYYLILMAICFFMFSIDTNVERRREAYRVMFSTFIRRLFSAAFFGFCYMTMFILSAFLTTDLIPTIALCGSAAILSVFIDQRKSLFNLIKPTLTYGRFCLTYGLSCIVAVGLFATFAFIGRDNVFDHSFSKKKRITSYEFAGVFAPPLDQESFKIIEPQFMGVKSRLYRDIDFDPSSLGVEFFLSKHSHQRLEDFLYIGNPNPEFLEHLYDNFETNPYWKDKKINSLKYQAFLKWPKDAKMPERFLAKQEELKKLRTQYLAEKKAKRVQARQTASEEE